MRRPNDFPTWVVRTLAIRTGHRCSNPVCRRLTSGPHSEDDKIVTTGEAAHVRSASEKGPRHDAAVSPEYVRSIKNGIWMCSSCSDMIDKDEKRYPVATLEAWRQAAEAAADAEMQRGIAATTITAFDRELFRTFLERLPYSRSIGFIDRFNMAGFRFDPNKLDDLYAILEQRNNAEHDFVHPVLESIRQSFLEVVKKCIIEIAQNTFPAGKNQCSNPAELESENPAEFRRVVETVHALAGDVVNVHATLIRTARQLGVG